MRPALLLASFLYAATFLPTTPARAQPYCAIYNGGESNCGIPTLASCQESVRGMGGYCAPDQTSQIPYGPIERARRSNQRTQQRLHPDAPQEDAPGGLNWMPPPPGL